MEDPTPRETALKAELESLRRVNAVIESVIASLEKARQNMATVLQTVGHATALLDTWTRILSRTEYTQRLILNPAWKGASQDAVDAERDVADRRRERERREFEEVRRREAAEDKRRAEEARRTLESTVSSTTRGAGRGRGRGVARGVARMEEPVTPAPAERTRGTPGRAAIMQYGRVRSRGTTGRGTRRT